MNKIQEDKTMIGTVTMHQVQGKQYKVWSDFNMRATYAEDENGKVKCLRGSGYLSNDLTIRKAIALCWDLKSCRK